MIDLSLYKPYQLVSITLRNGATFTANISNISNRSKYCYIVNYPPHGSSLRYTKEGKYWDTENPLDIVKVDVRNLCKELSNPELLMARIELAEQELAELKRQYRLLAQYSNVLAMSEGQVMVDGWGIVKKVEGMALLLHQKFPGADESFPLKTSGTFDPSVHQLKLAKAVFPDWFSDDDWYVTSDTDKRVFNFYNDSLIDSNLAKTLDNDRKVRCEFRCVTFDPSN